MAFTMKLQSPNYDAVNGYEIALPATADSYAGDSMAAILALFDGNNKVLDFRQYRETVVLVGVLSQSAATSSGFVNPVQMRDELIRIRAAHAQFGKNNTATSKSWLNEGGAGFAFSSADWGTASLPAAERDSGTTRKAATCRLIYDQYWHPTDAVYKNLFIYGTVSNVSFAGRPGSTTLTRIPFSVTFLAGSIKVGE